MLVGESSSTLCRTMHMKFKKHEVGTEKEAKALLRNAEGLLRSKHSEEASRRTFVVASDSCHARSLGVRVALYFYSERGSTHRGIDV